MRNKMRGLAMVFHFCYILKCRAVMFDALSKVFFFTNIYILEFTGETSR